MVHRLFTCLLALLAAVPTPLPAQSGFDVRFGVIKVDANSQPHFVETQRVPNIEGQGYGWIVRDNIDRPIRWVERLTLPAAPASWGEAGHNSTVVISKDRRTATTTVDVVPGNSPIMHFWGVAPGDPVGVYHIQLSIGGTDPVSFEFEVR